jgi:hypothetical protein
VRTNVRIERVVLDGLELSRRERDALAPAIARELRRLAGERADEPALAVDRRADPERRGPGSAVDGIAREVAVAVHRAVGSTTAAWPAAGPAAPRGRG